MTDKFVLHEYSASGNCYKVRLTAAMVGVPLDRREYDIMKGETRRPVFLETRQFERPHSGASGRDPLHPREQRRLLFHRRRVAPDPDRSVRSCRYAPLDVLGAV